MMTDVVLQVTPVGAGWLVGCDLPLEPAYFHSGAQAERMARDLALRICDAGQDVRVFVVDRAHQTVATQRYFAL